MKPNMAQYWQCWRVEATPPFFQLVKQIQRSNTKLSKIRIINYVVQILLCVVRLYAQLIHRYTLVFCVEGWLIDLSYTFFGDIQEVSNKLNCGVESSQDSELRDTLISSVVVFSKRFVTIKITIFKAPPDRTRKFEMQLIHISPCVWS